LRLVEELLRREPASAELNFLCGAALVNAQAAEKAAPFLEKAVQFDSTLVAARAALGQAYLLLGRAQDAIPHLHAALKEDQDGSRHYQLARAYRAAGRREQAAAAMQKYRELRKQAQQRATEEEPPITPP